jgi:hypothetical protein
MKYSYVNDAWNRREHASKSRHEAAFSVVGDATMMLSLKALEAGGKE